MQNGTIIYIGNFELPDRNAAAHRVLNNAKIFRELGYNVVFLDVDRDEGNNRLFYEKDNIQGFKCWSVRSPKTAVQGMKFYFDIKYFKQIVKTYNDIKYVVCYNFQSGAFLRIKKYCRVNKIKLIADCTEWYESKNMIRSIDNFLRMELIQKNIDGVICISSFLEKYYKDYTHTLRIPPLCDKSEQKWNCKRINLKDATVNFVYAGVPGAHKDKLNLVLQALSDFKQNFYLYIIGLTKEHYLKYYPEHKELVEVMSNRIEFTGRLSHIKSLQYVKSADFSIFIREDKRVNNAGFPTKFVESISCGTPVITTNTSDLKDFVIEGKNGILIDDCSIDSIKTKLAKVLNMDRQRIEDMEYYCKKHSNLFDYMNYREAFRKFIDEVEI